MFDNSRCFEPTFTLNGTPILPRGCQAPIAQGKAEAFGCGNPPGCQLGVRRREAAFSEAVELFLAQNGEEPCTAHDIYYAMGEIPFLLACDGEEGNRLARVEENLARALALNWSDYDIAGDYRW